MPPLEVLLAATALFGRIIGQAGAERGPLEHYKPPKKKPRERELRGNRLQRPESYRYPLFDTLSGAHRTTLKAVRKFLKSKDAGSYLAGTLWPSKDYLDASTLITGKPRSGKTTSMKMLMRSDCNRFYPDDAEPFRMFVLDPTQAMLPFMTQIVPPWVPNWRLTPFDAGGCAWAIWKDVDTLSRAQAFVAALTDTAKSKGRDPF